MCVRRMVKIFCMCEEDGENVFYALGGWWECFVSGRRMLKMFC